VLVEVSAPDGTRPVAGPAAATGAESLESFMAKVRALSAEARPDRPRAAMVEAVDPDLRDALARHAPGPTADTSRAVAHEYARLGIFDRAYQFFSQAIRLNPSDAAAYDGLARLWRTSGLPQLGLTDGYRAVFHAPDSPIAHNTLGTVLQALGHLKAARAQYERALQIDPGASYALNNLCYGWVLEANAPKAIEACRAALQLQPDMKSAHNNLALAQAMAGDVDAALASFSRGGDEAEALYNAGIVHLARRDYGSAVKAFTAAHAVRPTMRHAAARARQAAAHASTKSEE
jgi:tetratricopeptide (TPR) repeat protein